MKDVFEKLDKSNLYQTVYTQISTALVDGALKPDEKLRIRALAEQLGTSVTPVRDALLKLVQDGALEWRGPKDIRVPRMRVSQFEEIRVIRIKIEGLAASLAAEKSTPGDIQELRSILSKIEVARDADDNTLAIRFNHQFHAKIAKVAGLPLLVDMIERMWLRMGPVISSIYEVGGQAMIVHYYDLMKALEQRNGPGAAAAIAEDINAAAKVIHSSGVLLPD